MSLPFPSSGLAYWFMDIEPLWTLGGWFIFLFLDCMAAPKSPLTPDHTKYNPLLLLIPLIFFLFLLLHTPMHSINLPSSSASNMTAAISSRRFLLQITSSKSPPSTTNLRPYEHKQPNASSSQRSSHREFGADAHDVPSGPNPISNR